jgi:hypothetical protein
MANIDYWEFVGDSTTIVDHLASDTYDRTLGETESQTLVFRPAGRATGHETRAETVQAYLAHAGVATVSRTNDGGVYYDEPSYPASAPNSLVVKLAPSPAQTDTQFEGIWGLVTGGSAPNRLANRIVLDLELAYLGDASDYADRAAVETALTDSVI